MSDTPPTTPTNDEPEARESLPVPVPQSWDEVLARAATRDEATDAAPARAGRHAVWLRLAVPALILIVYAVYKIAGSGTRTRGPGEVLEPDSLTGVAADVQRVRIDSETRAFVARLEAMKARGSWDEVRTTVEAAPPAMQAHPVVHAFLLIARVERGSRSPAIANEIRDLEQLFAAEADQRPMLDYLRLMRGEILLSLCDTPEALLRYTDRFRAIVAGQAVVTPRAVEFRIALAECYERIADKETKEAGRFMADEVRLTLARSLYQQALRWVSTADGWIALQPIAAGRAGIVHERLIGKLREANKRVHGPSLPMSGKDSESWSGRSGDPVHDYPGGTW